MKEKRGISRDCYQCENSESCKYKQIIHSKCFRLIKNPGKHFQGYYYTNEKINRALLRKIDESIVIENVKHYELSQKE